MLIRRSAPVACSFHLSCLNGFPGPYVKGAPRRVARLLRSLACRSTAHRSRGCSSADFLEALNEEGLWDLVRRYDDRGAIAACRLCVADLRPSAPALPSAGAGEGAASAAPEPRLVLYTGVLAGGCVAPRGDVRHGKRSWNSLFVPAAAEGGDGRTFGEMSLQEQSRMSHRNRALAAFLDECGPPKPQALA